MALDCCWSERRLMGSERTSGAKTERGPRPTSGWRAEAGSGRFMVPLLLPMFCWQLSQQGTTRKVTGGFKAGFGGRPMPTGSCWGLVDGWQWAGSGPFVAVCAKVGCAGEADVWSPLPVFARIQGAQRRRAAPDRPLGRALLHRHQQNFGGRG
jgi:hypothetical protein